MTAGDVQTHLDFGNLATGAAIIVAPMVAVLGLCVALWALVTGQWGWGDLYRWPAVQAAVMLCSGLLAFVFCVQWLDAMVEGEPSWLDDHFPVVKWEVEDDLETPVRGEF